MSDSQPAGLERWAMEQGVLRTLYGYIQTVDDEDFDTWLDWFTDDAVFEVKSEGSATVAYRGAAELREWAAQLSAAPGAAWHGLAAPFVTVTRDGTATATSSFFSFVEGSDGAPIVFAYGRYFDELVRGTDDTWRVKHRIAEVGGVNTASSGPGSRLSTATHRA